MDDITQFLMSHGGSVLFAIVFAEQAGLPLPSALWLLAAGAGSASCDSIAVCHLPGTRALVAHSVYSRVMVWRPWLLRNSFLGWAQ